MADLIRQNWTGRRFYKILKRKSDKEANDKDSNINDIQCSSEGTLNDKHFLVEIIIKQTKFDGQDCK